MAATELSVEILPVYHPFPKQQICGSEEFLPSVMQEKSYVSQSDFPKVLHFFDSFFLKYLNYIISCS